jgi:hypothetical protein
MDPPVATYDLLVRWRQAERALVDLERDAPGWKAARFIADQAWQDYEARLNGERAEREGSAR